MKRLALASLTSAFVLVCNAFGYDQNVVHPRMTKLAFATAQQSSGFLGLLGLKSDGSSVDFWAGFAATGAHDEDNGFTPKNHFYDPVHESPLVFASPDYGCVPAGAGNGQYTARQWATVTLDNPNGLRAAKNHLAAAVLSGAPLTRDHEVKALFNSLGHIMHLVQDMAQPQHTRNDAHPTSDDQSCLNPTNVGTCWLDELNLWSRYENWCRDHLNADGQYLGYSVVDLPSNGAYFKSGDGRGMAEYSNSNFVTEHTNYSDQACPPFSYADPDETLTLRRHETHIVTYLTMTPPPNIDFVQQTITLDDDVLSFATNDDYTGLVQVNRNHSFYSIFDYDIGKKVNGLPVYSLPEAALASQAALLVPRAVGYSAGFVKHFFRGRINASWTLTGTNTYSLSITNASTEPLSNFTIHAKYRVPAVGTHGAAQGEDLVTILDQSQAANVSVAPGESYIVQNIVIPSLLPGEKIDGFERRIAVEGTLGSEPGVVSPLVQAPSGDVVVTVDCWNAGGCPIRSADTGQLTTDYDVLPVPYGGTWSTPCSFDDPIGSAGVVTGVTASAVGQWNNGRCDKFGGCFLGFEPVSMSLNATLLGSTTAGGFVICEITPGLPVSVPTVTLQGTSGIPGYVYGGRNTLFIGGSGTLPPDEFGNTSTVYLEKGVLKLHVKWN